MIDEDRTMQLYGYTSRDLSPKSNKTIIVVCENCGKYRTTTMGSYRDLCKSCGQTGKKRPPFTEEHRRNMSIAQQKRVLYPPVTDEARHNISEAAKKRPPRTEEHCRNISKSGRGRKMPPVTDETRRKQSESHKGKNTSPLTKEHKEKLSKAHTGKTTSTEHKQHISAGHQGIPYEEWTGYVANGEYCEKFDEPCRERIRAKYNYRCFVCDQIQDENITKNGEHRKLAVHHVDKNKEQGCNGVKWNLIPVCIHCHGRVHTKTWVARIKYLLEPDDN